LNLRDAIKKKLYCSLLSRDCLETYTLSFEAASIERELKRGFAPLLIYFSLPLVRGRG